MAGAGKKLIKNMKRNRFIIGVAAVLILIFGSLLFVFQVRQSQVAVVTTFGKITGDPVTEPGAHFRWPWRIQNVYNLDQRIQNFEGKFEEAQLADQNILMMMVYVGWRIEDPGLFYNGFPSGNVSEAEKHLADVVQTAKNEVIGQASLSDLISADEKKMKFTQIESNILARVQERVKSQKYGIEIKFLQIKKLGLPESVTKTVFERMASERQVVIVKIQSDGAADASRTRADADSKAAQILNAADAESLKIRGDGEAKAASYLKEFRKNPELAAFNMKLTALEQMLKEKTTLILDQSTPPLDLLIKGQSVSTNLEPVKK